jgi:uncharacterized protein YegJ (DUF2314 family)
MLRVPLVLTLTALLAACGSDRGQTVKRQGQPDIVVVSAENTAMNAAVFRARASLPEFKASLATPPAGATGFAVKVAFPYGADNREHIWLLEPSFSDGQVSGIVNNEPEFVSSLKLGQRATQPEGQVSDWMYVREGVLHGGFTIRAALEALSPAERESQMRSMGLRLE